MLSFVGEMLDDGLTSHRISKSVNRKSYRQDVKYTMCVL